MTRGLIVDRLWLKAREGRGRSSSEVEGVKGRPRLCESGLEGGDEEVEDGDLYESLEHDEDVGSGGSGGLKLTSVNTTGSSAISSRVVRSTFEVALSACRRCALAVEAGVGMESKSSSGIISRGT